MHCRACAASGTCRQPNPAAPPISARPSLRSRPSRATRRPGWPLRRSAYGDWLAALSLVDLDDLLLRTTAELGRVSGLAFRSRPYRFVHIDEYQDVSGVQRELFGALSADGAAVLRSVIQISRSMPSRRQPRSLLCLPGRLSRCPGVLSAGKLSLARAAGAAASALIAHSPAPPGSGLPPGPTAQATRPAGAPIEVQAGSSPLAEAIAVARQIERLVGGTSLTSHDQGRAAAWASGQVGFF